MDIITRQCSHASSAFHGYSRNLFNKGTIDSEGTIRSLVALYYDDRDKKGHEHCSEYERDAGFYYEYATTHLRISPAQGLSRLRPSLNRATACRTALEIMALGTRSGSFDGVPLLMIVADTAARLGADVLDHAHSSSGHAYIVSNRAVLDGRKHHGHHVSQFEPEYE